MASEDSREFHGPFLLIVRTRRIFTADEGRGRRVARDTRMSQHIVGFCNRPSEKQARSYGYSYRRRLPGLRFEASPEG